jgi:uncharacterized membrane protein
VTRRRLELLQWFGLLAAPLAWATQLVVGYFVTQAACGGAGGVRSWTIPLTALAAAVAVGAQVSAFTLYRELQEVEQDAPGPAGRLRFLAVAALVGNVLFFALIALGGLGAIFHVPCRGS